MLLFAVQAPLLGPHAFGILATVMVFAGFWEAVPGAAAIDALISIREIDRRHFSAVTLLSTLAASLLGIGLWALSRPLANALGDEGFTPIMRAMAILPLLQALTIAPMAAAQREMRFRSLTIRTVISLLAGGGFGLVAALAGAGVWALVWQSLIQRGVAVIVLWLSVPTLITARMSMGHIGDVAKFAMPNMVSRMMSWASGQIPRLILSVFLGPTRLGVFTLATRLNDIVTQVAIGPKATVARVDLRQFELDRGNLSLSLRRVFLHISVLTFPLCIGGAAIMHPLIYAWLDPRWHGAVLPCQLMLLIGIPFVSIYVSASLLLAFNRQNWEAIICAGQSLATILGVWIAAPYGVSAAVAAVAIVSAATFPVVVIVMWRECGVRLKDVLGPQLRPFMAAVIMGIVILALRPALESHLGGKAALLTEFLGGAAIYAGLATAMAPTTVLGMVRQLASILAVPVASQEAGSAGPSKSTVRLDT